MFQVIYKFQSLNKRYSYLLYKNFRKNILPKQSKFYLFNKSMMQTSEDNKRITKGTEHSIQKQDGKIGGEFQKTPKPQFLDERLKIWDELYAKQQEFQKSLPREKITITLRDGKQVEGISFDTSPLDIAKKYLKKSLVGDLVIAKVKF